MEMCFGLPQPDVHLKSLFLSDMYTTSSSFVLLGLAFLRIPITQLVPLLFPWESMNSIATAPSCMPRNKKHK